MEQLVRANGCTIVKGEALLKDTHTLIVGDKEVEFEHLIVATGSYPAPPPFKAEEGCPLVDSDGFLSLEVLPERVVIVGGGVIGIEFATILADIGKKVTIVEAQERILPGMDAELASFTQVELEKKSVRFVTSALLTHVAKDGDGCLCAIKTRSEELQEPCDLVICAIGRRPATAWLRAEANGIRLSRGFVSVDDFCATNIPNIYAVGDANGKSMLAHAATAQAKQVVANLTSDKKRPCDFSVIPSCVYTSPELASVGLTEEQAAAAGRKVKIGRFDAAGNGKLLTMSENRGFVKLIADSATQELLGAHICSAHATDIISSLAIAIKSELTTEEIAQTIHPHPTISEMVMEAADDCLDACVHKIYRNK